MIKNVLSVVGGLIISICSSYTYASMNPIQYNLFQGFPDEVYVQGGTYVAIYSFTNQLPFTLISPLIIDKNATPASEFSYDDLCSEKHLIPNESCQVKIYLNPTSSGQKTIQLIESYGFNRVPVPALSTLATDSSGGTSISGELTTPLASPLVLNQSSPWKMTYSNDGASPATGISISVTGSPGGYSTTCGDTVNAFGVPVLNPGANCYVQGTLIPTSQGSYTVTSGFSYAQGATVYVPTTSSTNSSAGALSCTPAVGFASEILTNSTNNQVTLLCTNKSTSNITFTNTASGSAVLQGGMFSTALPTPSAQNNCNSTETTSLGPTASCQLTGTYTAPVTAQPNVSIILSVNYDISGGLSGQTASTSTSTNVVTTINNSRIITINNNCDFSVWWGMVGGAVTGANPAACPLGSTLNNGRCLYNGTPPTTGGYLLAANNGTATTTIVNTAASTIGGILWSGVLAGQTKCSGTSCANNDCGSNGGTTQCSAGFQQPATEAEFTFLLTGSGNVDTYDITQVNGFSVPMSMSTTNQTVNEYTCGTAGSTATQGSLPAANYNNIVPPTQMYYWVSDLASCTASNTCEQSGQICGLTFSAATNGFVKACGGFLGYWAANQICQTTPTFSSPFGDNFNCQQYLSTPFPSNTYTLTQLLKCSPPDSTQPLFNSCYLTYTGASANSLQQCCGCTDWAGIASPSSTCPSGQVDPQWVDNVLNLITWMKRANPTGYSYPYDDKASTFQCPASAVTQYTITFCPGNQTGLPAGKTDGR